MSNNSVHPVSTPKAELQPFTPQQPFHFGRFQGLGNVQALAAFWYSDKHAMIPYLAGYLQTVQEPAYRRAAQGLYDMLTGMQVQTCNPQDNGESYAAWRYPNVY